MHRVSWLSARIHQRPVVVILLLKIRQFQRLLEVTRAVGAPAGALIDAVDIDEKVIIRGDLRGTVKIRLRLFLLVHHQVQAPAQEQHVRLRPAGGEIAVDLHGLFVLPVPGAGESQIEIDVADELRAGIVRVKEALLQGNARVRAVPLKELAQSGPAVGLRQKTLLFNDLLKDLLRVFVLPFLEKL